ncbi:MAG: hypothetical protein ACJAYE_002414 [Candidatus Azotimanducaceae bacterium]|jgi:uncharacterized protein (DUF1330 family)
MTAFLILDSVIHDTESYDEYKRQAKPIAEKYGGAYRARGGALEVIEADLWTPTRIVVIEFPAVKNAQDFLNSDEYASVKPLRENSADCTVFILDGG